MSYKIEFTIQAQLDIEYHKKAGNKLILNKILTFLNELTIHPTEGTGKPELLKYDLSGKWSRRISKEHRLVYKILDNVVFILSAKGHYEDK